MVYAALGAHLSTKRWQVTSCRWPILSITPTICLVVIRRQPHLSDFLSCLRSDVFRNKRDWF